MSEAISFILNGELQQVSDVPATMTLLQWLRTKARLTGTKEGCAEGDCGACTVIVGRLDGDEVTYRALNACIAFLPTLDGREIITVEHLDQLSGKMHPAQQAMVDCHGSQCGFCTPGFVVSLAALLHAYDNPNDTQIQDAIAGNLCRCTGYRPILDAAREAAQTGQITLPDHAATLKTIQRKQTFAYEAADTRYFAPTTSKELADLLHQHPTATLLAGGTDVGLWVTKMHMDLPVVIYTGNVADLRNIDCASEGITIGAAVSYSGAFAALAAYDPSMEDLLRRLGSVQIRNAGTVGGNIANGSPIGDGMPPLIALGATISLRSASGTRTLNLEDYFIEYRHQDRKEDEFLESVFVPAKAENVLFKTYKISKRFDQDISAVCSAVALEMDGDTIKAARIAYGGMAGTPKRATHAEQALTGKSWNDASVRDAMAALDQDFQPMTDMRASADYRQQVAKNLLMRTYVETTSDAASGVYRYGT